jgi:hypothetical protein
MARKSIQHIAMKISIFCANMRPEKFISYQLVINIKGLDRRSEAFIIHKSDIFCHFWRKLNPELYYKEFKCQLIPR